MKQTTKAWTGVGLAAIAAGSVVGINHSAHAADAACAAPWSAATAYTGGATVSSNGTNYTANWWTQGNDPTSHSGKAGSGQPWTATGTCTSSSSAAPVASPSASASRSAAPTATAAGPSNSATTTAAAGTGSANGLLFSPYKDVAINPDWNTGVAQTKVNGSAKPLAGSGSSLAAGEPKLGAVSLAFATGTCGSETWGGTAAKTFADADISRLNSSNLDYIVSTGGAAGAFKCASGDAMRSFIRTYAGPHLVGVDFDIESGQSSADIQSLVKSAADAQSAYPNLRFSFTLATTAASDGSYGGLNSTGDTVMKAIGGSSLKNYSINLMTMDYGRASSSVCVVSGSTCDMGRSAIQAAENLEHTYNVPASKVELTPMIGVNDVADENFSLTDVDTVTAYAKSHGLAGLHFWSLDRDTPCVAAQTTASPTCNSVAGSKPLAWTDRFLRGLGR